MEAQVGRGEDGKLIHWCFVALSRPTHRSLHNRGYFERYWIHMLFIDSWKTDMMD